MFKNKAKRYCIASGCRTSDKNSTRSFFSLPTQQKHAERRQKWLKLLGREDLLGKSETKPTYFVCSAHFDRSAVKIVKHLKDTALPTKCLANQPQPLYPEDDIEDMEGDDTDDETPLSAISNPHKQTNSNLVLIPDLPKSNKDIKVNIKIEPQTEPQIKQEFSEVEPQAEAQIEQEFSKVEPQTEPYIKQEFSEVEGQTEPYIKQEFSEVEPQTEPHIEQERSKVEPQTEQQTKLVTKIPKKRKVKKKNASGHSWMK